MVCLKSTYQAHAKQLNCKVFRREQCSLLYEENYMNFFNTIIKEKVFLILASITILLSWLIPNHYVPWLTSHSEFFAFASLIILSIFIFKFINHIYIPKNNIFILLLILIPIIQFLLGKIFFWGDAFIVFIYLFSFFYALCLGFNISKGPFLKQNIYLIFYSMILFASVVSVFLAMKQWLLQSSGQLWLVDFPLNARPFANFAQPNTLATFLCMGLMASLYLYEKKYINKFSGVLISSYILFGITLTQSRTAWVFSFAFLIWWFWKTNYFQTRLKKWSVLYFIGIYIFFVVTIPYISHYLGVVNTSDIFTRATTGYLRIPMWNQMLVAIKNEPWWGYGWNQVSVAQISVFLQYPTTEWTEHSHNILLDLLIWNGIPLGLLIIIFFIWWLYRLSKLATTIESFVTLAMVGSVLVHAMLEYPLEYAFFLLPVGFLLGLVQAEDKKIKEIYIPRSFIGLFLIVSIALYIWVFVEYRIIEQDVQMVRYESLNIGTVHAEQAAPKVILLTQLREQIRFIRTAPIENMSQEQLDWMRYITYRFATSSALYRYAQALALNNQPELAKKHLLILEKLHGKKYSFESLFQVNKSLAFEWQNKSISKP